MFQRDQKVDKFVAMENGPYLIRQANGNTFALCRCGHSKSKPYCDGSHQKAVFLVPVFDDIDGLEGTGEFIGLQAPEANLLT